MALQQSTKFYDAVCDVPACICADAEVVFFLRDDLLTTDGKPYATGTVITVTETSTGGVNVVIQYDDTTLPLVDGLPLEVIFDTGSVTGTVCDPDCSGECDWMGKVLALFGTNAGMGLIHLQYVLYQPNEWVEDGTFEIPRIGLNPGLVLSAVKLTCATYDLDTTLTFNLKVGSTVHAQYIGNLSAQKSCTLLVPSLPNDVLPVIEITGVTSAIYADAAKGLVMQFIGVPG